jgi:thiamine-phosphate pyrophosphorylase
MFDQVIDANINRVSEGLRVIEEYTRFVWKEKKLTKILSSLRKSLNDVLPQSDSLLHIRDIELDMRAKEIPTERKTLKALLIANFKRVEEGLRVLEEYTGNPAFNSARYDVYQLEKKIILPLSKGSLKSGIYLISSEVDVLKKGIEWGVSLVQLRDKTSSKQSLLERAINVKTYLKNTDTKFIINDFLDIALFVDADGLHTGQDDIDLSQLRTVIGEHKLLGRTTHSLEQGLEAEAQGADYVSVGPVWETPSKPGRSGIGFDYLEKAKTSLTIPYVAIGGINADRIKEVIDYAPPLVGLIRDFENIPTYQKMFK